MSNERKLARSPNNRWFAGVCGGLGEYFNIDPTIVRILFVLVTLIFSFGIGGIIVYAILWVLMPESDTSAPSAKILEDE